MVVFYHQTKTPIGFLCRCELNLRSLIQPLKTLSVKLIRIYKQCKPYVLGLSSNDLARDVKVAKIIKTFFKKG